MEDHVSLEPILSKHHLPFLQLIAIVALFGLSIYFLWRILETAYKRIAKHFEEKRHAEEKQRRTIAELVKQFNASVHDLRGLRAQVDDLGSQIELLRAASVLPSPVAPNPTKTPLLGHASI